VNITVPTKFSDYNDLLKINQHVMIINVNMKISGDRHFVSFTKDTKVIISYILIRE